MLVFPYYNGSSLGDLLEIVPYPAHFAKVVAIQEGGGKARPPTKVKIVSEEEQERGCQPMRARPIPYSCVCASI